MPARRETPRWKHHSASAPGFTAMTKGEPIITFSAVPAITTEGLRKVYPIAAPKKRRGGPPAFGPPPGPGQMAAMASGARELVALEGLDLEVGEGEFFGL